MSLPNITPAPLEFLANPYLSYGSDHIISAKGPSSGISLFLSIIYSTYSIYTFITEDLKHHIRLKNQLEIANKCFLNKEYKEYIFMYKTCLKELSEDASTQIKLAKANFVLSETDSSYFINGVNLLNQKQLKLSEFNEILSFVPEKYKEAFKSCFK